MSKGRLISFEGIDGCGKSTQIRRACDWLRGRGLDAEVLQEPGGTEVGEAIRHILLTAAEAAIEMDGLTEYLLFAASRAQLTRQVICPLLEKEAIVLLDRFSDSSLAYQGYGRGVDLDFIRRVNETATGGLKPNITILLDLAPDVALARISGGKDRIERGGMDFLRRVRDGFILMATAEPKRFRIVDAGSDIEMVFKKVVGLLEELFHNRI